MESIKEVKWRKACQDKAPSTCSPHNLIPVSWTLTPKSKHVTVLMCTCCFHEINMSDIYENRSKD